MVGRRCEGGRAESIAQKAAQQVDGHVWEPGRLAASQTTIALGSPSTVLSLAKDKYDSVASCCCALDVHAMSSAAVV